MADAVAADLTQRGAQPAAGIAVGVRRGGAETDQAGDDAGGAGFPAGDLGLRAGGEHRRVGQHGEGARGGSA